MGIQSNTLATMWARPGSHKGEGREEGLAGGWVPPLARLKSNTYGGERNITSSTFQSKRMFDRVASYCHTQQKISSSLIYL